MSADPPLAPEALEGLLAVSRETISRLKTYADLLALWQRAVNLVAPSTLPELWRRHVLDSGQLFRHLPRQPCRLADLGSGAGFPGLVLAIMGAGEVHLVESDARKCAFLREASRKTGAAVVIHESRIEGLPDGGFEVVTARALAPLETLLGHAARLLAPGGSALFLKGRRADEELTAAGKAWKMRLERFPSLSDPGGCILRIDEIAHAHHNR